MESEAQLRDYADYVLSTLRFVRSLDEGGRIDAETYERARRYLDRHDQDKCDRGDPTIVTQPIFLDDLAITYLQEADVFRSICSQGLDLRVHPATGTEKEALISVERKSEKLIAEIEKLRSQIAHGLRAGKIKFLPRHRHQEDSIDTVAALAPAAIRFVRNAGDCDAVCIDDRFFNKHAAIGDDGSDRSVRVTCVLDVIRSFKRCSVLTVEQSWACLHRLRQAGFALVPIDSDELSRRLRAASLGADGKLVETAELRVLRQTFMRVRSLGLLQRNTEGIFLTKLRMVTGAAIREIWEDEALPIPLSVGLTDWIWRSLVPSPLDWAGPVADPQEKAQLIDAFAQHLGMMLAPMPRVGGKRYTAFRNWLEQEILDPLLPANADLVAKATQLMRNQIERLSTHFGAE